MSEKQGLLDRFTRTDELMAEMVPLLKQIASSGVVVKPPQDGEKTLEDIYDLLEEQHAKNYEIFYLTYPDDGTRATFAVGTTLLDFEHGTIKAPGGAVTKMSTSLEMQKKDFMRSFAVNANHDVIIQLDENNKSPVRANTWGKMTYQQFTKAYVTATVSTTGYVHACTNPEAIHEQIGEITVAVGREERAQVKSLIATHFTGALAQYAAEEESLTGLASSEITITSVTVYAEQALDIHLLLFETDTFQETTAADMDDDEFMEFISIDIPTDGIQYKNANGYYVAVTDLNIDYEDLDASNELHVGLEIVGATAKLASGSGGNVWVKFSYIPRL